MGSLPGKMAIRLFENIVISTICQFSVVRYAVVTFPVLVERESTSEPVCRMMSMRLSKGLQSRSRALDIKLSSDVGMKLLPPLFDAASPSSAGAC